MSKKFILGKKLLILAIVPALVVGVSPSSYAQNNPSAGMQAPHAAAPDMRASDVIGAQVRNVQGEKLGKIEDIVVDVDHEKAHYAVLSSGGTLGVGGRQVAIPVSAFATAGRRDLVLNIAKNQLGNAPEFKRVEGGYNAGTFRGIDRLFFKEDQSRYAPNGARLLGASELIGKKVNDRAAHDAGKIADLVINFSTGRTYAVMKADAGDKLLAMPLQAFSFPRRPDLDLLLNVDRTSVETARGFEQDKWPDLNSADAKREIGNQLLSFQAQTRSNPSATQTGRETSSGSSR